MERDWQSISTLTLSDVESDIGYCSASSNMEIINIYERGYGRFLLQDVRNIRMCIIASGFQDILNLDYLCTLCHYTGRHNGFHIPIFQHYMQNYFDICKCVSVRNF